MKKYLRSISTPDKEHLMVTDLLNKGHASAVGL